MTNSNLSVNRYLKLNNVKIGVTIITVALFYLRRWYSLNMNTQSTKKLTGEISMANYQDFMQRADKTALSLIRSSQNWTAFWETAARLYKYPYNEQPMIYSQRPDAIACAEFDVCNKRSSSSLCG